MSGFCGWLGSERAPDERADVLAAMAETLVAGDPAIIRTWHGGGAGVALRAPAPIASWHQDDDLVALIRGYPRWSVPALADKAAAKGHAAALADAYGRYGEALLQHLRGHFSLAVLAPRRGEGLLAIDRFGVEALCYAPLADGTIVFGSTADAVRAHPSVGATIAPQTIHDYLYFIDRVCAPATVYREQRKLRPAECLVMREGGYDAHNYWQMPYRENGLRDQREAGEALFDHLKRAVARSIEGEEPARLGAFLSGGLDSSTVVGLLAGATDTKARAFTVGFRNPDYDESDYAQTAAGAYGVDHVVAYLEPEAVLAMLTDVSQIFDEPFANASALPTFHCARAAVGHGVGTMIAGDGGDELFGGNTRYVTDDFFDHYRRIPRPLRRLCLEPVMDAFPLKSKIPIVRKAANYMRNARTPVPVRMTWINLYFLASGAEIFSEEAWQAIDPQEPHRFVTEIYEAPTGAAKLQRMMHVDLQITLADGDLRKVGRMCAHAGARVRYPFLDDDLVEFSASLPPGWLNEGGQIRNFYKMALRGFLPEAILTKSKKGFGLPNFVFIRDYPPLNQAFCDLLTDAKQRGLFRVAFLDHLIACVRGGQPQVYFGCVWDIAVLELWLKSRMADGPIS